MRAIRQITLLLLLLATAGCSSNFYSSVGESYSDDLYGTHDRAAIAHQKEAAAEAARVAAAARQAELEALMAEVQRRGGVVQLDGGEEYAPQGYLADSYESAYARRLRGFSSLSYKMPSSYYDLRYSPEYQMLTVYDPMNYNIVVMGDEVWVEPKYISSMFGTWGAPSYGGWYGGFYYDYLWPSSYYYSWWGYPRYSWWDYNNYWFYGWPIYGPFWPGPIPPFGPQGPPPAGSGGESHPPHYPNYRPASGGHYPAGVRPSSPHTSPRGNYNYREGSTIGGSRGGNYRGTTPSEGVSRPTQERPSYSGSSNYRSRENNTQRREEQNNYRHERQQPNYNSSSGSNYRSGTSGAGGFRPSGGGGGNYRPSGGGNYRGR